MSEAADAIIRLYQRHGLEWADSRGTVLRDGGWLDRFCGLLPAGGAVLDLGCGSGQPVAAGLVARGFGVTGVDTAPALVARARAALPGQSWMVADMRGLALGRRFAGVLAWDSFFHLGHDDQRAMFAVFAAHAAPGAALMFTSGTEHGEALGEFAGEVLYHASLDAAAYRALLAAHGFAVVAQVAADAACGGRNVWLARRG